jgi:hypothetical protein
MAKRPSHHHNRIAGWMRSGPIYRNEGRMMDKLRTMTAAVALIVTAAAFWPEQSVAATAGSPSAQSSYKAWKRDDSCAKRAFEINSDYTREGIAARDKYIHDCEMKSQTPIRDRVAPTQRPQ